MYQIPRLQEGAVLSVFPNSPIKRKKIAINTQKPFGEIISDQSVDKECLNNTDPKKQNTASKQLIN